MIAVRDYVRDAAGTLWCVAALVSDKDGEHAILLPAKPIIRFVVDIRDKRERVLVDTLTVVDEITVTEKLSQEAGETKS